jgi:Uma2 family endonuclease
MSAIPDKPHMTPDEYLAWESHQERKHEYVAGAITLMPDVTIPHNSVTLNLMVAIKQHLGKRGRVFVSAVKVFEPTLPAFFYPDLLVTQQEQDRRAIEFIQFPCLIAEVLSPETEAYDRGAKFAHYRRLESLREYVLISSDSLNVEIFRLNDRHKWELTPYAAGETVQLTSIEFECAIELLYEDVDLTPADEPNPNANSVEA